MAVSIALHACSCLRCDLRDATFAQQEISSSKTMHQPKPCLRARLNCWPKSVFMGVARACSNRTWPIKLIAIVVQEGGREQDWSQRCRDQVEAERKFVHAGRLIL